MGKGIVCPGCIYHVFTRSIAGFKIFNNSVDFSRMKASIHYYQREDRPISFSRFLRFKQGKTKRLRTEIPMEEEQKLVEVVAYCLMPTHVHLVLQQLKENGIAVYMSNILNSYTRYFNVKHNRKGPLWEGRFKRVLVDTDEQLLHLTRYVHLNPVTARLLDDPLEWGASSYHEYLQQNSEGAICTFDGLLDVDSEEYKRFVEDHISYQRDLAQIKSLILE